MCLMRKPRINTTQFGCIESPVYYLFVHPSTTRTDQVLKLCSIPLEVAKPGSGSTSGLMTGCHRFLMVLKCLAPTDPSRSSTMYSLFR